MPSRAVSAAVFTLLAVAACAPSGGRMQAANADGDIRALVQRWNQGVASQDDSAVTSLYAGDAVVMPDRAPIASGHDAIAQLWKGFLAQKPDLVATPTEITVAESGDLAVERGTYTLSLSTDQGTIADRGKYLVVWKPMANGWKITTDIWNSDLENPPVTPPDSTTARSK